ncbi:protein kinase [Candidatus Sumerlaeota bacterium]|nr:protein kinase [Candidatus Sumerlaeota bacterium]
MESLTPAGEVVAGRYILVAPVGEGKCGIVWQAEELSEDNGEYALKFLPASLLSDERAMRSLHLEAQLIISLNHPQLMRVHSLDCHDDNPFLVMELLDGPTLAQILLRRRRLTPDETRAIAIQICQGLEHAHGVGLVHLNLTPANLMLAGPLPDPDHPLTDPSIRIKITDTGIARILMGRIEEGSRHAALGSLTHMSPELIRGERVDDRSDIYSLGCVLYHLLAGHPPFQGQYVVRKHFTKRPERIVSCPEDLWKVIAKCLEKEPGDRYQSARELRQALLTAERPRPRRLLLIAAVCAALTLGLAAGTLWLPKSRTETPAPPATAPPSLVPNLPPETASLPAPAPSEPDDVREEYIIPMPLELAALETPPEPETTDPMTLPPELVIIESQAPADPMAIPETAEELPEETIASAALREEPTPAVEETETAPENSAGTQEVEDPEPDDPEPVETATALPTPEPSAESSAPDTDEITSADSATDDAPEAEETPSEPEPETRRQRLRRIFGGFAVEVRDGAVSVGEDLHETVTDVRDYIRGD